jgi:formylmethanofuran dehydrogenase subunit E
MGILSEAVMETAEANPKLDEMLAQTEAMHKHLCPRQVLGVRMGLYAAEILGRETPQQDKRLIAFVESDGCFADGVSVATGCSLGHRTMRLMDYGKVAATIVDTETGRAVRLAPKADVRQRAAEVAGDAPSRWRGQLEAYQRIASEDMFNVQEVRMCLDVKAIVGMPGIRVNCAVCGEEILNQREVVREEKNLCQSCAGESYWSLAE